MICKPCRSAGNAIAALEAAKILYSHPGYRDALELYEKCKGGTWCDRNPRTTEVKK